MKKVLLLTITISLACCMCFAQSAKSARKKIVNLRGEYTYVVPENVTLEQAKKIARERAIQQCLADEFGTLVGQNNATVMHTVNGQTDTKNYSIGSVVVKGEWLGDTKAPVYTTTINDKTGELIVIVKVWGKASKLESATTNVSVKVLCNGTDERYEREIVYEGDRFYVSLSSLSDGYVCMYLIDEDGNALCLLPYINESAGSHPIEGNKRHVFFSPEHSDNADIVDEYIMSCARDSEVNTLYVIFSPNKFSRPLEDITTEDAIQLQNLEDWLLKARLDDPDMQLIRQNIIIKKVR